MRTGVKSAYALFSIHHALCARPTTHGVTVRSTLARSRFMKASWLARNVAPLLYVYASAVKTRKCVSPWLKE